MTVAHVLALTGITKRFGNALALDAVDFALRPGTIHALIGENGAGKTTLMRIAYGLVQPDTGSIEINGKSVQVRSPADAIGHGIGMVHQHYMNVPAMTVAENVALGRRGRFDAAAVADEVRALSAQVGLSLDPFALTESLGVAAQQRLEILKALARHARVLILDEPTAVLAPGEAADLLTWLRRFVEGGGAAVLITHKLNDARTIADDITVLRHGRVVSHGPATQATTDSLAAAMLGSRSLRAVEDVEGAAPSFLGRQPSEIPRLATLARDDTQVVRAAALCFRDARAIVRLHETSFDIRAGELVGVAGVEGSGHHELMQLLARRLRPTTGTVTSFRETSPTSPEDRHRDAMVLEFTVAENIALKSAAARRGLIPWRTMTQRATATIEAFDVRGAAASTPVRNLSGGNQQKLVLGRELDGHPALVVAVNPTRGLDIRATAAVHDQLRIARNAGAAVVVYSSDLDELLSMATRLFVMHDGVLTETVLDRDAAGAAMLGVT